MNSIQRPVIMGFPRRYIQGRGVSEQVGELISIFASSVAIVADDLIWNTYKNTILKSLSKSNITSKRLIFTGECTHAEIEKLGKDAKGLECVLAVGGGKAIDTAKGIASVLSSEVIIFPTIASNDSPTSRLVVVYSDAHVVQTAEKMTLNPAAVIVDTEIIKDAPKRFLLAGIGDAISKIFEVTQSSAAGAANFFGGTPSQTAMAIARECHKIIMEDSESALAAHSIGEINSAFERLVEATILMSGLAFENGGLSIAHAVLRGFSNNPDFSRSLHGEQVAFGLLVQLLTNTKYYKTAVDLRTFYSKIGLPCNLKELGAKDDAKTIANDIAKFTFENAPYVMNVEEPLDKEKLAEAIVLADHLANDKKAL